MLTIYAITNQRNGKVYVGQTAVPLRYRIKEHFDLLTRGKHTAKGLQNDYNRGDSFEISVLEETDTKNRVKKELSWMERLRTYDSAYGYNDLDPYVKPLRKKAGLYVAPSKLKGRRRNAERCWV